MGGKMKIKGSLRFKVEYILVTFITIFSVYIGIRFLLPVLAPFVVGFLLSKLVLPFINFLNLKLNFHRTTATIISIILMAGLLFLISYFLIVKLSTQITVFIKNWDIFSLNISHITRDCCNLVEKLTGLPSRNIYNQLYSCILTATDSISKKLMPIVMNYSLSTVRCLFDVFIFLLVAAIAMFFFSRDNKEINSFLLNCRFRDEILFLRRIAKNVVAAYIKTQFIIICIIAAICTLGFTILKNPYSILYGIIIGILDFLPLIGAGTFLVPISIYYLFKANYPAAVLTFVIFVVCYLVREILEPKLLGSRIGIHPLVSLISVYIGYKVFGLLGMILGPFGYVFVSEVQKVFCEYKKPS